MCSCPRLTVVLYAIVVYKRSNATPAGIDDDVSYSTRNNIPHEYDGACHPVLPCCCSVKSPYLCESAHVAFFSFTAERKQRDIQHGIVKILALVEVLVVTVCH